MFSTAFHVSRSWHGAFLCISQVLVTALIDVIVKWLLNILSLLLLLMYLFGVCGVYFFGYKTNETRDEEHWGSLPTAMLTLFGFVTVSYPQIHYLVKFCFRSQHKKCLMISVDEKGMLFLGTYSQVRSRILSRQFLLLSYCFLDAVRWMDRRAE